MSSLPVIEIPARDCSPFENQVGHSEAIQYFISNINSLNIFHIEEKDKNEDLEVAYFNTRDALWYAGRLVGEAQFQYNGRPYKIIIRPRFGDIQFFKMIEEVFNIKLSQSKGSINNDDNYQYLIKQLIAFIWVNLLSKANKHGVPKHNIVKQYKGAIVRGRLDVRKSIIPLHVEEKIVSRYNEKAVDSDISNILIRAYKILKTEYKLSKIKMSSGAKNAIEQLLTSHNIDNSVTQSDYNRIKYNDIYKSFKPVVELSWDIIKKKNFNNNKQSDSDSMSFFMDMAELWDCLLYTSPSPRD